MDRSAIRFSILNSPFYVQRCTFKLHFLTPRLSAWPTNLSKQRALNSASDSSKLKRGRSICSARLLETSLLVALKFLDWKCASNPAGSRSKMMSAQDDQQPARPTRTSRKFESSSLRTVAEESDSFLTWSELATVFVRRFSSKIWTCYVLLRNLYLHFLSSNNMIVVSHPPYSPDLAPCDFAMFTRMKSKLKGRRFEAREEIQREAEGCSTALKPNTSWKSLKNGADDKIAAFVLTVIISNETVAICFKICKIWFLLSYDIDVLPLGNS